MTNTIRGVLLASVFAFSAANAQDSAPKPGLEGSNSPAFLPMPEPVFENFKKPETGIDPKVWPVADGPEADFIKSRHARLPRKLSYVTRHVLANKPDESKLSEVTEEFTVMQDGYVYVRSNGGVEASELRGTVVTWLGLLPVYSRSHVTFQITVLVEGSVTKTIVDMGGTNLKPSTLAPGAAFTADFAYNNQIFTRSIGAFLTTAPKPAERRLPGGLNCKVGERVPASDLYAEFTGTALKVACTVNAPQPTTTLAYYLEDYAWFFTTETKRGGNSSEAKITSMSKN